MQLILVFLGDVMLGRLVNERLKEKEPSFIWGNTLPVLQSASANFANLETTITDWGEPIPGKTFCFRTDSKNVAALKEAKISAVSLANNHILDFGERGLKETIKNLKKAKIAFAGAGEDWQAVKKPAILKVNQLKIAFIAATDNQPEWEAKRSEPGVFFVPGKWPFI